MWRTGSGMPSQSRVARASPPKVRWSTKRISRPSKARVEVTLIRLVGIAHQHLTAHPQMDDESFAAVQRQPEILPTTLRRLDQSAAQTGGQVLRTRLMSARNPQATELSNLDDPAGGMRRQTPANDLDFGEFRHGQSPTATAGMGRSCNSRHAAAAAPCSASFLVRPVAVPNT